MKPLVTALVAFAALLGFAAPAHAETVSFSMTTQTKGNCVAKVNYEAITHPDNHGNVYKRVSTDTVGGLPGISGDCTVTVTLKWHNLDSGAKGQVTDDIMLNDQECPVLRCLHIENLPTGPGRVALELGSPLQHTPGKAEIVAYP